ncbi:MAG: 5'-nucleotidase, lipoprotein e(P4) family, partial [Desulfobacteraceae bacterium]|nr:5'-nucleotidase, lipoprotein e(P4) family [Desulfobacteraceae bacterium]
EYDKNEHYVMAVLWFQTAAEAQALYYQAFNLAEMKLDEALQSHTGGEKLAVIVDIDETVLDNSPCRAELIKTDKDFTTCWLEWMDLAEAKPLPGAKAFLDYAASCGVEVFYVSNRFEAQRETTIENLVSVGFPYADDDHVYLREGGPSKESRRQAIAENYEIILLIGDNVNDFADVFQDKLVPDRAAEVNSLKDEFGNTFIVLPNPMYGDWEDAVYEYERPLRDEEKDSLRKEMLEGYSE